MDTANSQLGLDYESIYTYIWKQNSDIVKYIRILFSHLHNILDTAVKSESREKIMLYNKKTQRNAVFFMFSPFRFLIASASRLG